MSTIEPPAAAPGLLDTDQDEAVVGGSARARDASLALRALARAARAFALYDPKNEIIRRFLSEYRTSVEAALRDHGDLTFDVKPFELHLGAEVVYREQDRERSLAFRLFRDGIRKLILHPGLDWDECVGLLEILSVRFTGVRQQEDDLVTLFRKAGFEKIGYSAAEGFAPTEDRPEPDLEQPGKSRAATTRCPPDFDQPFPARAPPVSFSFREVPATYLEALRGEEDPRAVPHLAVRLASELLAAADGPASQLSTVEVMPLLIEVRDYCIADGCYGALLELVRATRAVHGIGSEQLPALVEAIGGESQLNQLLDCLPRDALTAPPELCSLLQEVPGNHVGRIVARLNETQDPQLKRVLKELMGSLASSNAGALVDQLHDADRKTADQLVSVLMVSAPGQAMASAAKLAEHDDPSMQLQALEILARAPPSAEVSALLGKLAVSPDDGVFARAAQAIAAVRDRKGFDLLARQAEVRAEAGSLTGESATALGEALASLSPTTAYALLKQWAAPRTSLLGRLVVSSQTRWLQMVAVAGIGLLAVPDVESLIREVHGKTSDEELKQHCVGTLNKRRRHAPGRPHG